MSILPLPGTKSTEINCFSGPVKKFENVWFQTIFNVTEVMNKMLDEYTDMSERSKRDFLEKNLGLGFINPSLTFLKKRFVDMFTKGEKTFVYKLHEMDVEEITLFKSDTTLIPALRTLSEISKSDTPLDVGAIIDPLISKRTGMPFDFNNTFQYTLIDPRKMDSLELDKYMTIQSKLRLATSQGVCNYYIVRTLSRGSDDKLSQLMKIRGQHTVIVYEIINDDNTREYYSFGFGFIGKSQEQNVVFKLLKSAPSFLQNLPGYNKLIKLATDAIGSIYTPDYLLLNKLQIAKARKDDSEYIEIIDYGKTEQIHLNRTEELLNKNTINAVLSPKLYYEYKLTADGSREDVFYLGYDSDSDNIQTITSGFYREGVFNPFGQATCSIKRPANCSSIAQYIFQDKINCEKIIGIPYTEGYISGFNAPDNCARIDGTKPDCADILTFN